MIFAQFQFPTLVSVLLGQLAYIACVTSFLWCTPRLPKNLSFMDGLDGTSNYVIHQWSSLIGRRRPPSTADYRRPAGTGIRPGRDGI